MIWDDGLQESIQAMKLWGKIKIMIEESKLCADKIIATILSTNENNEIVAIFNPEEEYKKILYDNTMYLIEKLMCTEIYTHESLWDLSEPWFENRYDSAIKKDVHVVSMRVPTWSINTIDEEELILDYVDQHEIDTVIGHLRYFWQKRKLIYRES